MAATWDGWQADFLGAAGIIVTPPNMDFLGDWHAHAPGTCNFNPIDLSTAAGKSTRCGATVAGFGRTQNYPTHADAEQAFKHQITAASMKPLKAALDTGNPFQIGDRASAVAAIVKWGSPQFAAWYKTATASGQTGGSKGSSTADLMGGWHSLRRSLNRNWRRGLNRGEHNLNAALRSLSHSRKVHR